MVDTDCATDMPSVADMQAFADEVARRVAGFHTPETAQPGRIRSVLNDMDIGEAAEFIATVAGARGFKMPVIPSVSVSAIGRCGDVIVAVYPSYDIATDKVAVFLTASLAA